MSEKVDPAKTIGFQSEPTKDRCTEKDAILYSLGIAYNQDPLQKEEFQYTYELHENFKVFPTFCTVLPKSDLFKALTDCPGLPNFNPMMLLHGEQRIQILKPIKPQTDYVTKGKIADVADKGKGALLTFQSTSYEVDNNGKETPAFVNTIALFIRGIGGFGYKGTPQEAIPTPPKRNPCKVVEQKTYPNQALVYRLSGDFNPLHIDPDMAAMGGFDKPILHGLATYGMCAKNIVQSFLNGDGDKVKGYQARFTSHVFPGETLIISMWKEGNRIIFTAKTQERGLDVISGSLDIKEEAKL